jgi:hypothetical protein
MSVHTFSDEIEVPLLALEDTRDALRDPQMREKKIALQSIQWKRIVNQIIKDWKGFGVIPINRGGAGLPDKKAYTEDRFIEDPTCYPIGDSMYACKYSTKFFFIADACTGAY